MKTAFSVLLISSLFFSACKKEKQQCNTAYSEETDSDTIAPSPYLMAYPGSVWNYDDGSTETCDTWQQVGLIQTSELNGCKSVHTTHKIAAHTSFGYVIGTDELVFPGTEEITLYKPLLAETTGNFYEHVTQVHYDQFGGTDTETRNVIEFLDSMEVSGVTYHDIVHVSTYHQLYSNHTHSGGSTEKRSYYARNVGLIRTEEFFNFVPATVRNLVSYTIGPH
jgi:hypothetical protein